MNLDIINKRCYFKTRHWVVVFRWFKATTNDTRGFEADFMCEPGRIHSNTRLWHKQKYHFGIRGIYTREQEFNTGKQAQEFNYIQKRGLT